jgi:hypothetical protein
MVSFPEHAKEGSEDTLLYLTCIRIRGLSDQSEALQNIEVNPDRILRKCLSLNILLALLLYTMKLADGLLIK